MGSEAEPHGCPPQAPSESEPPGSNPSKRKRPSQRQRTGPPVLPEAQGRTSQQCVCMSPLPTAWGFLHLWGSGHRAASWMQQERGGSTLLQLACPPHPGCFPRRVEPPSSSGKCVRDPLLQGRQPPSRPSEPLCPALCSHALAVILFCMSHVHSLKGMALRLLG